MVVKMNHITSHLLRLVCPVIPDFHKCTILSPLPANQLPRSNAKLDCLVWVANAGTFATFS